MFTLICARINGWVNNHEAGDLRRNPAHYDVIVMITIIMPMKSFRQDPWRAGFGCRPWSKRDLQWDGIAHPETYIRFTLLCCFYLWFGKMRLCPYPSGSLSRGWGNHTSVPVPMIKSWNIAVNEWYDTNDNFNALVINQRIAHVHIFLKISCAKIQSRHEAYFVVTGSTGGCQNDKIRCHQ